MKNKKSVAFSIVCLVLAIVISVGIWIYLSSNHLTLLEKKFIEDSSSSGTVINVNVLNDANLLGYSGKGVYFNFLDDFAEKYGFNINKVAYNHGATVSGVTLGVKTSLDKNDEVLFTDHFVLVSKNKKELSNASSLMGKSIAVFASDLSYISSFLQESNISFVTYTSIDDIIKAVDDGKDAIIPLHLYLDKILSIDNINVVYHFSDMEMYYTLSTVNDTVSSVLRKFYESWKPNFNKYYNEELFSLLATSLNISQTEIEAMQSIKYKYGYVNNSPYEVISSGNYGGIVAMYLNGFSNLADVDFEFQRYKNFSKFNKAIKDGKVDLYFDYYNTESSLTKLSNGINAAFYVIANKKNDLVVTNVASLKGKTVYVDKNSNLEVYLTGIKDVDVKTYNGAKGLTKLNKKDAIILLDKNIYEYYKNHGLGNYTIRYTSDVDFVYSFKLANTSALYKMLNKYIEITDPAKTVTTGFYNHEKTVKSGIILSYLAKYFMYALALFLVILFIVIKKTRKVTIAKKIKKDDTLRFIDQLTMLKNRNYLSENISKWNNNTIYPQTIVVIDLNHLQAINDTKGYSEGDKQIKAAANALIKTQLDNSEIIRTDGNEFVVYLVGYSQKQITNYLHKITKEFSKLPYEYGAEFGYSMIIDDIKTIEDALNEAVKDVKDQKEKNEESED